MNTLDLNDIIDRYSDKSISEILESFEKELNHMFAQLKAAVSCNDNNKIKIVLTSIYNYCQFIHAQRLQEACRSMIQHIANVYSFNVEAMRLKSETKFQKFFHSQAVPLKNEVIEMLHNSNIFLPSKSDSQYPSEIPILPKRMAEVSFDPVSLFQSLQFKRRPEELVVVKKQSACRCIIFWSW